MNLINWLLFILSFSLFIFGIYLFIYILKGWKKGALDSSLRLIVIQLAFATILRNLPLTILIFRSARNYSCFDGSNDHNTKMLCKILFLGEPLVFTIPSLFSTYIWTLEKVLSSKNYLKLYPITSYLILILINWIIPYAFYLCLSFFNYKTFCEPIN